MAIRIPRGKADEIVGRIIESLRAYEADHPDAQIDVYRQNSVSVRVRIVDPTFSGATRVQRNEKVWQYLDLLSDDDQSDLSTLVLITPEETATSFANLEFDDPVPSKL